MFRFAQHDRRETQFSASTPLASSLNDPEIVPDSHCTEPHVQIGETDPEQTHPCPKHVAAIETAHTCISAVACWRTRKLVQKPAGQVSQRMAANGIAAQQNNIDRKHNRADADSKAISKPQRFPNVNRKHD